MDFIAIRYDFKGYTLFMVYKIPSLWYFPAR
jgi:hypothetical protein